MLFTSVQSQQQDRCTCSCCVGQFCSPTIVGSLQLQSCTVGTCFALCSSVYPQCQSSPPNGQVLPQCSSVVVPTQNCRCDCCYKNPYTCTPTLVGYTATYVCQSSSCSIACNTAYPSQCAASPSVEVVGTCIGQITTTTTTTTTALSTNYPGLGYTCSCVCCSSTSSCSSYYNIGSTTASQCSAYSCTQACQSRYPTACSSLVPNGPMNGICTSQVSGYTRCQCRCCTANVCPTYEINTYGGCTSCSQLCQQQSPCGNTNTVTYTCTTSKSEISHEISVLMVILLTIVILL